MNSVSNLVAFFELKQKNNTDNNKETFHSKNIIENHFENNIFDNMLYQIDKLTVQLEKNSTTISIK